MKGDFRETRGARNTPHVVGGGKGGRDLRAGRQVKRKVGQTAGWRVVVAVEQDCGPSCSGESQVSRPA